MKFLGSSKITPVMRIQLIKAVAEILKVKDGDHVLFYRDGNRIIIKKG